MATRMIQLKWDKRAVTSTDCVRFSVRVPAMFSSLAAWNSFRDLLEEWEDRVELAFVAQLDPFWLARLPATSPPTEIVICGFAEMVADEGFRLRAALHEASIRASHL